MRSRAPRRNEFATGREDGPILQFVWVAALQGGRADYRSCTAHYRVAARLVRLVCRLKLGGGRGVEFLEAFR